MSSDGSRADDLLDRLVLDIKAIALLDDAEEGLRRKVKDTLLVTHDESVKRFVDSVQRSPDPQTGRLAAIAAGEIILASFLMVLGTVAIVPDMVGVRTPDGVLSYFLSGVSQQFVASPLYQFASVLSLVVGAALLTTAFYALRQAAGTLRRARLVPRSGED